MLLFFVLAGASLHVDSLVTVGLAGAAYVALRAVARIAGATMGARLSGLPLGEGRMMGLALMPQAGVAIGMTLVVQEQFPGIGETVLAITVASTVVFELIGPFLTQYALE